MTNKRKGYFWLKGLGLFLMIMLLFTIISRAADSFTIAKVEVNNPSARKLQYTVQADGRIEKNREIAVITQSDILIKSVLVNAGQRVEKGDILSILDQKDLQERIESIQGEKRTLELQNEAVKKNTTDNTIEINNISIRNLNKQINKLTALQKRKGQIAAPANGVITEVLAGVGQKTTETAMFTMTDEKTGLKFVGQIPVQDTKHIFVGDIVSLKGTESETEAAVTSLDMDESREFINVSVLLPTNCFSLRESVSMNLIQESRDYPCTVPLSAIYQENGKYYVFTLETENTILGKQQIVRKTEVKILEQNDSYAALEPEGLKEGCKIIISSDRALNTGDRVRLK